MVIIMMMIIGGVLYYEKKKTVQFIFLFLHNSKATYYGEFQRFENLFSGNKKKLYFANVCNPHSSSAKTIHSDRYYITGIILVKFPHLQIRTDRSE